MLAIRDLTYENELNREAMAAVFGGGHYCWGNYDHIHSGRWRVAGYSSFYKYVNRYGRRYRLLQRKWTLVRRQIRHVGRLYVRRG